MLVETVELRVSAADLVRQFGRWQEAAASRPVIVTHHGRDRFVLQSAAAFAASRAQARHESAGCDHGMLLDQMSEGYLALDAGMRVTAINSPAASYLRLSRAQTLGACLFEEHGALGRSLLFGHLVRAHRTGALASFETPSPIFPDRWLMVRTFPLPDDGVACLLSDVTDGMMERREEAEAAALVRAISAHGGVARLSITSRGRLQSVGTDLAETIGLPIETLERARLIDILPVSRRAAAGEALEAVLSAGETRTLDTGLLSAGGGEVPARIALAPVRRHGDALHAVALITT